MPSLVKILSFLERGIMGLWWRWGVRSYLEGVGQGKARVCHRGLALPPRVPPSPGKLMPRIQRVCVALSRQLHQQG